MSELVVAIPSFRRPVYLHTLLRALAIIDRPDGGMRVLVADNDFVHREALNVCRQLAADLTDLNIECILVQQRGISFARNALVENILSNREVNYIAMIDDDESPEGRWLTELIRAQTMTGADVVGGPVQVQFETSPPKWMAKCGAFETNYQKTGRVDVIKATSNVLIHRSVFERLPPPWFDPIFARSGGEDADFFFRARERNITFAWAEDAVVIEACPATRMNLKWILARAYRIGNTRMRMILVRGGGWAIFTEVARAIVLVGAAPLYLLLSSWDRARFVRSLRRILGGVGKLTAVLGRQYNEYDNIHGR